MPPAPSVSIVGCYGLYPPGLVVRGVGNCRHASSIGVVGTAMAYMVLVMQVLGNEKWVWAQLLAWCITVMHISA